MIEQFNDSLFLLINASSHPPAWALVAARFLASEVIWAIPAMLVLGWLRGGDNTRRSLLEAGLAAAIGLLISGAIGVAWHHPRPFVIDLGHNFLKHAPDSSFPSDHLTFIWAVAFSLMFSASLRGAGAIVAVCGIPVAWARIYLGVHFPLDMAGALLVAIVSAWLCRIGWRRFPNALFLPALHAYRFLFAPLIQRGWVKP